MALPEVCGILHPYWSHRHGHRYFAPYPPDASGLELENVPQKADRVNLCIHDRRSVSYHLPLVV